MNTAEPPVEQPPPTEAELREAQTVRQFVVLVCGFLFLVGIGGITQGDWFQAVFSAAYTIGALGGMIGFLALGRGSRRWSRLVYLLALGIPFLAVFVSAAHRVRLDHLDLIERSQGERANPPKG